MTKIYNEIVIDMNPESPTFEETIYEDSFEYSGHMMMAGPILDQWLQDNPNYSIMGKYREWQEVVEMENILTSASKEDAAFVPSGGKYQLYVKDDKGIWKPKQGRIDANRFELFSGAGYQEFSSQQSLPGYVEQTEYGSESLTKESFFDASGKKLPPQEVARNLMAAGVEGSFGDVLNKVTDFMPKIEEVPEEEMGFAKEAMQRDVYSLSKEARKAGSQMQDAYSGMGTSMRAGVGAKMDIAKGFEEAQDVYQQDIYGLEQEQIADFESEVESTFFREGGRVPQMGETFLDMLTQLPDAGGS